MKRNGIILYSLLLIGLLMAWPIGYFVSQLEKPAAQDQLTQLDKMAGDLLQFTKKGDMEAAHLTIKKLAESFPKQTLPVSIRIESLHAVTQSILAAKKEFASTKTDEGRLLWYATQVRVAIDSLSNSKQPMWRTYYSSIANQMQNLLHTAVERDIAQFRVQFEENYRLYLAIKPAMSVQLKEEQMNQINAAYELLSKELRNDPLEWQTIREALRELNSGMQAAFIGEDKSAMAGPPGSGSPLTLIFSIAAAVSMALAYVGWKKYSGEQAKTI